LQLAEKLQSVFLVYLPGNTNAMFKKALALECAAPHFNPQTKHSTAAGTTNCAETQRVTAWYVCLSKGFVQLARNDGSNGR